MEKKKIYNSISTSDDSNSGFDNNLAILQHNKGRIAVKSDEEEDIQEEDAQEDKEEDKTGEYMLNSMHGTGLILNYTHDAELKQRRQVARWQK